ncbi:MAG: hypothetical protein RH859_08080 [Longimicrobiales bacterium]
MATRAKLPWVRIGTEGLAIVVSILIAFSIDAWWDGRQERARETVLLNGLLSDFRASEESLDWAIELSGRVVAASEALLEVEPAAAMEMSPAYLDSLLYVVTGLDLFTPSNGILSSLVASEGLAVISDAELRFDLARWLQRLGDVEKAQGWVERHYEDSYRPYLERRVPILRLAAAWEGAPLAADASTPVHELLRDIEFVNVLDSRRDLTDFYLSQLEGAEEDRTRIVTRLVSLTEG